MSYVDAPLRDFLDLVASRGPAPGGGCVAAITVAMAAGLVAMAARLSPDLRGGEQMVADAEQLRQRSVELADADAEAYAAVLATLSATRGMGADERQDQLRAAFDAAARVPLEVAELGADTVALAETVVAGGNPNLRGDSATAAYMADGAVRSAVALVRINVASGGCDQELVAQAARHAERAADGVRGVRGQLAA